MKHKPILTIIVFFVILIGLVIRNINYAPVLFHDWDEGIYAQVSWELYENNTLDTTFNDIVWLNKPPLSHALIAGTFALFGRDEFWPRMVMVFFGMALLVTTYLLSRKIMRGLYPKKLTRMGRHHKEILYLLPVLALAATPLFIERSIVLNTDIMLGVSWVGFFLASTFLPKLLFLFFGVVSKSIVGFYPALVSIFNLKKADLSVKKLPQLLILIVAPLIWHIISYIRFGDYFIQAHLFDQVVKRVVSPIELHFGGRLYYLSLMWDNASILNIFFLIALTIVGLTTAGFLIRQYQQSKKLLYLWIYLGIGAVVAIFYLIPGPTTSVNITIAGLALLLIVVMHLFWKRQYAPEDPPALPYLFILLSPAPFFALLMMSQSKISWYLITLLPLFVILLPYLYMTARFAFVRVALLVSVVGIFATSFIPATYGYKLGNYQPDPRLKIAECIAQTDPKELAVLVNAQERQNRMVLEATQLQTETSFTYGGSPSFVFYAQKDIEFFYNVEGFQENYWDYPILMLSTGDIGELGDAYATINETYERVCSDNDWEVYITKFD